MDLKALISIEIEVIWPLQKTTTTKEIKTNKTILDFTTKSTNRDLRQINNCFDPQKF